MRTKAVTRELGSLFARFAAQLAANPDAGMEQVLPATPPEDIVAIERRLGIPLPNSYREFLQVTRGFWLCGGAIQFSRQHPFYHDFPPYESLNAQQKRWVGVEGGGWPPPSQGMLCFAEYFLEADGDQVLFDVKKGLTRGEYPVVYYSHEATPPTVTRVATSFREWLNDHCIDDMA